jgi:2-polyprenyl-3-methyl-5-hydroxy-6-metoxy-1,4-benzoquinol methylase
VSADPNWFDGFFEADYLDEFGADIEEERTRREIDFVAEKLELEPGARVLDVACGHGRHSLELARRGFRVTGIDLSPRSLELAREAAERESLDIALVLRDARELDFDAEFDAAINLFTSVIGYFDDDAETRLVLERVARALRPGGSFLVDTINLLGLASRFRPTDWEELRSGTILLQRHDYDFRRARNNAVWTFVRPDGSRGELRHSLRVYAPHELMEMLESAGLEVVGSWGSFEGAELSFETWRLILRGDKR